MAFFRSFFVNVVVLFYASYTSAILLSEDPSQITVSNTRLSFTISKKTGAIEKLTLDDQNLLGTIHDDVPTPGGPTGNGRSGIGPYLDCYCIRNGTGNYTPGYIAPLYRTFNGTDFVGVEMSETFPSSGQILSMYWILNGEETGIHTFARVQYPKNPLGPTRQTLQEFRTLFRPNSDLWTHLSVNDGLAAPLPTKESMKNAKTVQDATWDLGTSETEPFVKEFSQYFTKYSFADTWRDHTVHGLFGEARDRGESWFDLLGEEKDRSQGTWGAWLVMNSRDTFYGGPGHSDLTVDGIVYNYMVSNHHGANAPNLTAGFDRTFGPAFYYFNHGARNSTLADLRQDATRYADPEWGQPFYDAVASFIPGYIPPSKRGKFHGSLSLPKQAKNAIAILSATRMDVQDNAASPNGYQYWSKINSKGEVTIPMVVPGTYRLTIQATGVFGEYVRDEIKITGGATTNKNVVTTSWNEESHGQEVWRIGTPDGSAGDYRHGFAKDKAHPRAPEEYRIFWGAYDFQKDFPSGVHFKIGESIEARDLNYVHWSEFNGRGGDNVSDWRIVWSQGNQIQSQGSKATVTIQLAGVKTSSGNSHILEDGKPWPDLPYTVLVNNQRLDVWNIPYYQSSSCAIRSGISCYNTKHSFVFNTTLLRPGDNEIVLRLPSSLKVTETSNLPGQVYVQYDALRLEIGD